MARQAPIKMPNLVRTANNLFIQKPAVSDASNTFLANALVRLTSGNLVLVATAGVLVYGQTPDKSHLATETVPTTLPRALGSGEDHYVWSLLEGVLAINVGSLSTNALVIGSSAAKPSDVTVGATYGIATATSGDYSGMQFLDPTETGNTLFQVVGFPDDVLQSDYNGRVYAKVIASKIQN